MILLTLEPASFQNMQTVDNLVIALFSEKEILGFCTFKTRCP